MSKYMPGQKVFAYVVMSSQGPNILTDGSNPEGKVLIERQGRGPSHTYNWMGGGSEMTYWMARKAGRGFMDDKAENVIWDDVTKRQMEHLIAEAKAA
jgi:hypothetical protein